MRKCAAISGFAVVMLLASVAAARAEELEQETSATLVPPAPCCGICQSYVALGALFLDRELAGSTAIVTQNGAAAFSSDDFGHHYQAGPRITIGQWTDCGCGAAVELDYFGQQHWRTTAAVSDSAGNLNVPVGANLGLGAFSAVELVDMAYSSRLHNAEVNWRQRGPMASWLAGIRYINVNEEFSLRAFEDRANPATGGSFNVSTDNHMIGFQLGGETNYPVARRLELALRGKAGIFANILSSDAQVVDPQVPVTLSSSRSRTEVAAALEGGLLLRCRLGERLSLYAGYEVFFIDGVGLAVEQGINTVATGSALYHGPGAGLEIRW